MGLLTWSGARAESPVEKAIATELATNLKSSGQMRDYKIGIKMKGSTAWLVGQVASEAQARTAVDIARHSEGVQRVISKLAITGEDEANPLEVEPHSQQVVQAQQVTRAGRGHSHVAQAGPALARPALSKPALSRPAVAGPTVAGRDRTGQARSRTSRARMPLAFAPARATGGHPGAARNVPAGYAASGPATMARVDGDGRPIPSSYVQGGVRRTRHDQPVMPGYAWPSYASYPNYAALTYPKQYSPTAWPFIGPFYPYPQVPLGWRKVTLEWDDGWWLLDFQDH